MNRIVLFFIMVSLGFSLYFKTIWSKMEFPNDSVTPFNFGTRNCAIGDVNGDSYGDFLTNCLYGSYCTDTTAINRVFLFLGGPNLATEPVLTFEEQCDSIFSIPFGFVINGLGDVNNDGYDDFAIVGDAITDTMAWGDIACGGKVCVYFGGPNLDTVPELIFHGNIQPNGSDWIGGTFANAVSGADINGDGFKDIIIGCGDYSPTWEWYDRMRGRVYIYYGGPVIDTVPDIIINGGNYYAPFPARYEQLGYAIDNLGDVNGDGYEDIVVGAPNNMEHGQGLGAAGKAYLFYGGNPMDTIPDWWFYGTQDLQCLGEIVSNAGDFNGDGYDDIMLGDYWYEEMLVSGRVLIFFGGPQLDTVPDWRINGWFGMSNCIGGSVDCVDDINEDGYDDVIIGNTSYRVSGVYGGRIILYYGGSTPDTIPDLQYIGTPPYEIDVGWNVCSAGDVNGDGLNEVLFGTNYPPLVPYPDVYGWVRVMKYCKTAKVDTVQIQGGDCYVLASWQGTHEESTSCYKLFKNVISDTIGWWQISIVNPHGAGVYSFTDRDVQFTKEQYYWLKIYGKSNDIDLFGPYKCVPIPLETKDFSAFWLISGAVQISWQVTGGDVIGYNLYREINGTKELVNPTPMPTGQNAYQDFGVRQHNDYKYWLGIVQSSGEERLIGPVIPCGVVGLSPNPFRTTLRIRVQASQQGVHDLTIYNVLGQRVKTIWKDKKAAGYQEVIWDGTDDRNRKLPAGVYYCVYEMGFNKSTVKIVLIK